MNQTINNLASNYNIFAVFGHMVSAIAMIFLIKDKDPLIIPYTESFSEWTNFIVLLPFQLKLFLVLFE